MSRMWNRAAIGVRLVFSAAESAPDRSACAARQHAEERLVVGVGPSVAVAVEVGVGRAGGAAGSRQAGEEGLDIGVGAGVAVGVVIAAAAEPGPGAAPTSQLPGARDLAG